MAYGDPFDPTTPGDLSDAGEGDDRIRELKRALDERLAPLFVADEWPDTDPLTINADRLSKTVPDSFVLSHGASLPAPIDENSPNLFYHTDEARLYAMNAAGDAYILVWNFEPPAVGLAADRPATPDYSGQLYMANDTKVLSVGNAAASGWIEISGSAGGAGSIINVGGTAMEVLHLDKEFVATGGHVYEFASADLPVEWRFNSSSGVAGQYDIERPQVGGVALVEDRFAAGAAGISTGSHATNVRFPTQAGDDGYVGTIEVYAAESSGAAIPVDAEFTIELTLMRPVS